MFQTTIIQRRRLIGVLISIIWIVIHYIFLFAHIESLGIVRLVSSTITATFFIFGALCLLLNSHKTHLIKVLAFEMGFLGLCAMTAMIIDIASQCETVTQSLLSPSRLTFGNTCAYICMLYPIDLLSRKKPNIVRYIVFFIPVLTLSTLYYVITSLFNLPIIEIYDWGTLLSHIGEFNVWFRFIIFIYPIWWFIMVIRMKVRHNKWCNDNSDMDYFSLNWINYYLLCYFLLLCSYIIAILGNNPQSYIINNFCLIAFFAFCFHRVISQTAQPTTTSDYFADFAESSNDLEYADDNADLIDDNAYKYHFIDNIPKYKVTLESWMTTDKPYLNKDFKLLDVMHILPLNRSYLSRMFNEGYSETFFSFVMRYRIYESLHLLKNRPDLTISRIALMCGFSSPSVFGRAFLKSEGITPKQYRNKYIK